MPDRPSPPANVAAFLTTGLALVDADLRVTWMNEAFADLLEVGVRGLQGQSFARLLEDPGLLAGATQRTRRDGVPVQWRDVRLATLQRRGRTVDLALQALDAGNWLLEVHVQVPRVRMPAPLSATLRGMAHEVKNPLAGLRGAAQLLSRRVDDTDARHLANLIVDEADRLAALTDRFLHHGRGAVLGEVNLHELLEGVRRLAAAQAPGVDIREDYDPSLPAVRGDGGRLRQLLLNLVGNAIEAGATQLCLRTRIAHRVGLPGGTARAAIRVEIVDNGPGVPEPLRDTLFQPLVSGRTDGTGLGLALALETARDHGGDLRHAANDEGTVFSLYLPLQLPMPHPAGEKQDDRRGGQP